MSDFRQLVTPPDGDDVIATAAVVLRMDGTTDGSVQVWSIAARTPQAEFGTVLDFGGRRLALCRSSDRMVVVAGAWERHRMCGYDARTGERLWERKDVKRTDCLREVVRRSHVEDAMVERQLDEIDDQGAVVQHEGAAPTAETTPGARGLHPLFLQATAWRL